MLLEGPMRIFERRIFIVSDDLLPMFKGGLIFCLKHKMGSLVLLFFKGRFYSKGKTILKDDNLRRDLLYL